LSSFVAYRCRYRRFRAAKDERMDRPTTAELLDCAARGDRIAAYWAARRLRPESVSDLIAWVKTGLPEGAVPSPKVADAIFDAFAVWSEGMSTHDALRALHNEPDPSVLEAM